MRWAVIGAGMLGLAIAERLGSDGEDVVLFEASGELGGLASAWQLGDVTWDRHYHVTLLSDLRTRAEFERIGLADQMSWVTTRTGYFGPDRRLRSVSSPVEFLALPGLRLIDKLRLGATIAYGATVRRGHRMERIGVEQWLRRWSGNRAFEVFWKPLLHAKLGQAYHDASAALIWATIRRLFAARRSGVGAERFGYVHGGYAAVADAFARRLQETGVDVRLRHPIAAVRRADQGLDVVPAGGATTERFDRVIVTTSAALAAELCPDLLPAERDRLSSVQYVGIVCASLLMRRPLADYYLTYITDPDAPFTAVVEMTALIDPAELAGHTLVYLPKYTDPGDPLFDATDEHVIDTFVDYLATVHPALDRDDIIASRVSRVRQVYAVPTPSYSDKMPLLGTSVPGLVVVGSANLPFSTLNVDDTLSLVEPALAEAGANE